VRLGAVGLVLALGSCGTEPSPGDGGDGDAGRVRPNEVRPSDAGAARPAVRPDARAPETPPPRPAPEGPTGEGPVLRVRDLPLPAVLEPGYEPVDVPWARLEALLVQTDAVSRGTRQSFAALTERPWGDRPVEPFAFRREAEPLARAGYWHPIERLSILVVPYDPLGSGGPNAAFYAVAEGGVRFIRVFPEHGVACAGGGALVEGLAVHQAGAEIRRLYGCTGIGEEGTVDVVKLEGRRLTTSITRGSFLVHRDDPGGPR
jgi:hypothetical protein